MESKPEYGVSPLAGFIKAIEIITLSLYHKFILNNRKSTVSYDDYKKHPDVIDAIDQIVKRINKK